MRSTSPVSAPTCSSSFRFDASNFAFSPVMRSTSPVSAPTCSSRRRLFSANLSFSSPSWSTSASSLALFSAKRLFSCSMRFTFSSSFWFDASKRAFSPAMRSTSPSSSLIAPSRRLLLAAKPATGGDRPTRWPSRSSRVHPPRLRAARSFSADIRSTSLVRFARAPLKAAVTATLRQPASGFLKFVPTICSLSSASFPLTNSPVLRTAVPMSLSLV